MSTLVLTLCILEKDGQILLGYKKQGLGAGRWNAFGGKIEEGESIEAAAMREMQEESGVTVPEVEKIGILEFDAPERPHIEMHVFKASDYIGEPKESDEMRPEWFHRSELPFSQMWQSDLYWWPLYFHKRLFHGKFTFDKYDHVIARELEEVDTLA